MLPPNAVCFDVMRLWAGFGVSAKPQVICAPGVTRGHTVQNTTGHAQEWPSPGTVNPVILSVPEFQPNLRKGGGGLLSGAWTPQMCLPGTQASDKPGSVIKAPRPVQPVSSVMSFVRSVEGRRGRWNGGFGSAFSARRFPHSTFMLLPQPLSLALALALALPAAVADILSCCCCCCLLPWFFAVAARLILYWCSRLVILLLFLLLPTIAVGVSVQACDELKHRSEKRRNHRRRPVMFVENTPEASNIPLPPPRDPPKGVAAIGPPPTEAAKTIAKLQGQHVGPEGKPAQVLFRCRVCPLTSGFVLGLPAPQTC